MSILWPNYSIRAHWQGGFSNGYPCPSLGSSFLWPGVRFPRNIHFLTYQEENENMDNPSVANPYFGDNLHRSLAYGNSWVLTHIDNLPVQAGVIVSLI